MQSLYFCPLPLLMKIALGEDLILLLFAVERQLHSFDVVELVVQLIAELSRSLSELDYRVVFFLLHFQQTDPEFFLLLRCGLQARRKSCHFLLEEGLIVDQISVLLSQLACLKPECIDFLDHFELSIAGEVEVGLKLSVLVLDAIVEDSQLILVVSLHLGQLCGPIEAIRLGLVGKFL